MYVNSDVEEKLYMKSSEFLAEAVYEIVGSKKRDSKVQKASLKMQEALRQENQACRLRKAIYELKQSGKRWYNHLQGILKKTRFLATSVESMCLHTKPSRKRGNNRSLRQRHISNN